MLRLTGGQYGGRTIAVPTHGHVRPTTARVRDSLFQKLQPELMGARFLDLFAGSGVIGLEALSRGATFVLAVEQDKPQYRSIQAAYEKLAIPSEAFRIVCRPVETLLAKAPEQPFDLAYLDPPYGSNLLDTVVQALILQAWIQPEGWVIVEHAPKDVLPSGAFESRSYGDTVVSRARMKDLAKNLL